MNSTIRPPVPQYEILRLPNGRHSGVSLEKRRWVLEVQKEGVKYYFDLALILQSIDKQQEPCYNGAHGKNGLEK